jgi:hypothetical protein
MKVTDGKLTKDRGHEGMRLMPATENKAIGGATPKFVGRMRIAQSLGRKGSVAGRGMS